MQVVDSERSERGPQRRKTESGRLLHCCCICGTLAVWGDGWSAYCSAKEMDDCAPYPKFCSEACRAKGGSEAENVTAEMKTKAKAAEWREPKTAYREATGVEKYREAARAQKAKRKDLVPDQ